MKLSMFRHAKKLFCFLLAAACLVFGAVRPVSANAPAPRYNFDIKVENAPEGAYAVDFLVPRDSIPEAEYTDLNRAGLAEAGFPDGCELARYEEDGYVSYLAHDTEGHPDGILSEGPGFLYAWSYSSGYDLMTRKGGSVRLALVDAQGSILTVSESFSPAASRPRQYYGDITFDAATGAVAAPQPENVASDGSSVASTVITTVFFALLLMVLAAVTILIELGVAALFRLRPVWHVLWVNLLTNLVFNGLLLYCCWIRYPPLPYTPFVLIGEAVIVLAEFLIYTGLYRDRKAGVLLAFSLAANLLSCLLVLFGSSVLFG